MPNALAAGLVDGMRFFQGMIEKTQMSGRPGLKTQTANLKRSGAVTSQILGRDFVAKVKWSAKYAMAHQKGITITPKTKSHLVFKIGNAWIKTKSVTIPKRLHVFEEFKNRGERIVYRNIEEQIAKAIV